MDQSGLDFNPPTSLAQELEPGLKRIVAANPSPMTFRGTNTYLLGHKRIAVIDPGPDDINQLTAILSTLKRGQKITNILVTHSHLDHSPLAGPLSEETGAKIYAFGMTGSGQSSIMRELACSGYKGFSEGIDDHFKPDFCVADEAEIVGSDEPLKAFHTPGHFGNHLSFVWKDALFSGDHIMDWATSMISPPDGDLSDFMKSCKRLQERSWRVFYPGHGAPVRSPNKRIAWIITHRNLREQQIIKKLRNGPNTAENLAKEIYISLPVSLLAAAAQNVFAHLIDLKGRDKVSCKEPCRIENKFVLK